MNFTISKQAFGNALAIVGHAVSSSSPQPYLRGIYIEASGNELVLTGSNADISIQKKVIADDENKLNIVEEGSILMEASYLNEIVKKLDADIISVEIIDGSLTRFAGSEAVFKINGMNTNDYPKIDFSKPMSSISMPASLLLEIIDQTTFAASTKETKPVLTGVNFHLADNVLKCTATDSYRLAKKTLDFKSDADFNITIPSKSLNEVRSTMLADAENIEIAQNDKKAQFWSEDMVLQTRLLDGGYPETDRLIPSEFTQKLTINRNDLIHAIDRTIFIKTDNITVDRLILSADELVLTNKSQEIGESTERLNGKYEGEPIDISFTGPYVMEACKVLHGDTVNVNFTGYMKPIIITCDDDPSVLHLILPVRTYN